MLFKLIGAYALLAFLTGAAEELCDGQDMLWSDIADNSTIKTAFTQFCSKLSTDSNGNFTAYGCLEIGGNHIDANVEFHVTVPAGGEVALNDGISGCENFLDTVRQSCEKGGSLQPDFGWVGLEGGGNISAYPKVHNC